MKIPRAVYWNLRLHSVAILAVLALLVYGFAQLGGTNRRLSGDEEHLARSMCDIHALLVLPPVRGQPPTPHRVKVIVRDLTGNLIGYCPKH